MFLALAVLLIQPQMQTPLSVNVSKLEAAAAESSAVATAAPNSAANPAVESSSSAAYSSSSSSASPAPMAYEPGMTILTPVPVAASQSSAISPAPAGRIATVKNAFLSVIAPRFETRHDQHMWMALSIAQHTAAGFDAWSTREAISTGQGQEMNPLLKPFAGNSSIYLATQVTPVALDYLARRMMYSSHSWERRTWWLPQVLGTASSLAAGAHNLTVRATPAP
jgi:hypothetical protein